MLKCEIWSDRGSRTSFEFRISGLRISTTKKLKTQNSLTTLNSQLSINMKPDIDCLKNLHSGQLQQLRIFIESLGYRKAAERASEEFNQQIHKTALQRFMRRAAPAEFLDDEPETDEALRQILKFAADGQPDFTA